MVATRSATAAKQQVAKSWTSQTSVVYDYVLSPFYDEVARVLWPAWLHPNAITTLGGIFCTLSVLAMQRGMWGARAGRSFCPLRSHSDRDSFRWP